MKKLKLLVVTAILGAGSLLFMMPGAANTAAAAADDLASPRSLYMQNCAGCHGANGKAETKLGRKYDADDISGGVGTSKTIRIVTNGKGHMPSFRKKLTPAQIQQVAGYVSGL
ncbi:MAG TPA: c-type cytochrome [Pyrinomonadaceae bacterium]|nr:c-type cytochrome [Pyrinomonadaceae bacterium]